MQCGVIVLTGVLAAATINDSPYLPSEGVVMFPYVTSRRICKRYASGKAKKKNRSRYRKYAVGRDRKAGGNLVCVI
jgi:hypothetical protein